MRNVADATSPPKSQHKQMEMWEIPTIHRFLNLCEKSRFGDLYNFAVLTGLRRSEICGLKLEAVDLLARRLSVVSTLQRIKGHGLVEGSPKTTRSRRSVALAPETVDLLHGVRGRQIAQSVEYGPLWDNTGHVFSRLDGSPTIPDQVTQDFGHLVGKHGLPHLTLHGLRHANATLAMTAGINPKIVSESLGHSTVGLTLDLYSHVTPNMQEEAAQAVANLLRRQPADFD
jgi:integrase